MTKPKAPIPVNRMTWINWIPQVVADCSEWIKVHGPHSPEVSDAYAAGVLDGMRQAANVLILHGHLVMED